MEYRRLYTPGGSFFFTVVTENRQPVFAEIEEINLLRNVFQGVMKRRPFQVDAIVILPDHLHCIWTLPPRDADYSTRWRLLKSGFTKKCHKKWHGIPNPARIRKGQKAVWQQRFWEHQIRDQVDYNRHIDYIHYNPVKHGYVEKATDWPYSSLKYFIDQGILPNNWGNSEVTFESRIGGE